LFDILDLWTYNKNMRVNTEKIKFELKRLKWTQTRLAKEIGMTRQGISYIMKKQTAPLKTIDRIAKPLHLDGKDLLCN